MTALGKNKQSKWTVYLDQCEQSSPRLFGASTLALAMILLAAHYTFGEWVYHPGIQLWKERLFWADLPAYVAMPLLMWCGWSIVSLGKLKISRFLLALAIVICVGDVIFYIVPNVLGSLQKIHLYPFKTPVEKWPWETYWHWWTLWMPVVLAIGNLLLLKRWWNLFAAKFLPLKSKTATPSKSNIIVKMISVFVAWAAFLLLAVRLILPQMPVNDTTLCLSGMFLVPSKLKDNFDYLIGNPAYNDKRLGAILDQVELADVQRKQFYPNLDNGFFQENILSPNIDDLPLEEADWRRALWENFYPRVRHETDPMAAAQIVARFLRERIGIDPNYDYRVGVETIWTQQMTDEVGFERIYVAGLRSIGIAARLNDNGKAELFADNQWQMAPRLPVYSFQSDESTSFSHVYFRNRAGDWIE